MMRLGCVLSGGLKSGGKESEDWECLGLGTIDLGHKVSEVVPLGCVLSRGQESWG